MYDRQVNTEESLNDLLETLSAENHWEILKDTANVVKLADGTTIVVTRNYMSKFKEFISNNTPIAQPHPKIAQTSMDNSNSANIDRQELIYGKDSTTHVVCTATGDQEKYLFIESPPGVVKTVVKPFKRWIIGVDKPRGKFTELAGNLTYKYLQEYDTEAGYKKARGYCYANRDDYYILNDEREQAMVRDGYTYFKGMKVQDVSVLSFDIETSGLKPDADDALLFMISNTYRAGEKLVSKLFSLDEFESEGAMIEAWVKWVNGLNPSIIVGHNIVSFDLPYLNTRAELNGLPGLELGRDGSRIKFNTRPSQIRVDGNQSYDYYKCSIFGREIVDTWVLSIKYDVGRDFPSYGLKPIIQHLGLEKEGRIKWDFSRLSPMDMWLNLDRYRTEFDRFKTYCSEDSDDSLKLYDIMIPSFFYLAQHIPKPFQTIIESASGAWLNSIMVRAYLQDNHSIPKANEPERVYGGISFGVPGIYKNVFKVDVKSMYPSIMRQFQIGPEGKDPKGYYPKMVEFFTLKRFKEKDMYKETGDKYYDDLQSASKIFINSTFGMLSCAGLNFNDFKAADRITGIGRQIIRKCLLWASGKDINLYIEDYNLDKDKKYEGII